MKTLEEQFKMDTDNGAGVVFLHRINDNDTLSIATIEDVQAYADQQVEAAVKQAKATGYVKGYYDRGGVQPALNQDAIEQAVKENDEMWRHQEIKDIENAKKQVRQERDTYWQEVLDKRMAHDNKLIDAAREEGYEQCRKNYANLEGQIVTTLEPRAALLQEIRDKLSKLKKTTVTYMDTAEYYRAKEIIDLLSTLN